MANIRKIQCVVDSVVDFGEGIYNVTLVPQSRLPRFSAGQFLHLAIDPYDPATFWPESRVFSIASMPSRTDPVEILYSVKGKFTTRMENELEKGKNVWIKLPYGEFLLDDIDKPRVLFAGGTGITAFVSLLKNIVNVGAEAPIQLVYGIRNENLFFYKDIIDAIVELGLVDRVWLFVEKGITQSNSGILSVCEGIIDFETVKNELLTGDDVQYFLAGPPKMLDVFSMKLKDHNISEDKIILDKWE